jgi:hypothetical protein
MSATNEEGVSFKKSREREILSTSIQPEERRAFGLLKRLFRPETFRPETRRLPGILELRLELGRVIPRVRLAPGVKTQASLQRRVGLVEGADGKDVDARLFCERGARGDGGR